MDQEQILTYILSARLLPSLRFQLLHRSAVKHEPLHTSMHVSGVAAGLGLPRLTQALAASVTVATADSDSKTNTVLKLDIDLAHLLDHSPALLAPLLKDHLGAVSAWTRVVLSIIQSGLFTNAVFAPLPESITLHLRLSSILPPFDFPRSDHHNTGLIPFAARLLSSSAVSEGEQFFRCAPWRWIGGRWEVLYYSRWLFIHWASIHDVCRHLQILPPPTRSPRTPRKVPHTTTSTRAVTWPCATNCSAFSYQAMWCEEWLGCAWTVST